ncbi:NACHT domain-containing NTPase [Afipia sp. GAS231]|uniref:NACHT domain-containing protein n=1 Tax=Afipia sp. GAS231 TaxID=1882747 RepID=UPI000879F657|nr:hypothetical protein [Afipia sp. GAS231]SDO20771.1 hypothetical protein SAMN05444050_3527 [Afipia sp. GAS231]
MTSRDDFSAKTIRTLAARVGHHCSNPDCVRSTSGPAIREDATINVGVAAHIAAAAPNGKRYDPKMTPAERGSGNNGIWLCQTCSKLIDSDDERYTVESLHRWKKDAIERALGAISAGRPLGQVKPSQQLDPADEEFLRGLDLPSGDALDIVAQRLRAASEADIQAFRAAHGHPKRTIARTIKLSGHQNSFVPLDGLARVVMLAEPVSIVAPGGIGKSTLLVQLSECMAWSDCPVPVLVPLGEWANRQEDFFDSVLRRNAFGVFRRQHLMQLAYHGRLCLVLDGWNELGAPARMRAIGDLKALQRDYPQLGMVISSRREEQPVSGPIFEVEPLSQDQQMELALAEHGQRGVDLLDRAWRTSGLRELVQNPLYLHALLALPEGRPFPETKEAVLKMFVEQTELARDKAERLHTFGQHNALLAGLAAEANRTSNTAISDSEANRVVSSVVQTLVTNGQVFLTTLPQPREIVDGLVNAHLVVRKSGPLGDVSFQHQLFQEWYAAAEVVDLMVRSAAGEADARRKLRQDVLDRPSWEESILFACDRLSRADEQGSAAVAAAIEETLAIDPILAAAMLDRASDRVWALLRHRILGFVNRWHRPGAIDRAVRFMAVSGKPEFADQIWPLASSTDDQVQFECFRAAGRFRPGVLGSDREARLRALPSRQRSLALSEIASHSGMDGMDLAATIAVNDPDPDVVVAIVEALEFRRGDQHVSKILEVASDQVWEKLAQKGYPERLASEKLNARLVSERAKVRDRETDPIRRLERIVHEKPTDAEEEIAALIEAADESFTDLHFTHAIARAHAAYPRAVGRGLLARILDDKPLPYDTRDLLDSVDPIDSDTIKEAALGSDATPRRQNAAASVAGPNTVSALFDLLFALDDQIQTLFPSGSAPLYDQFRRVEDALTATRPDVFWPILIAHGETAVSRRISLLAELLRRHGRDVGDDKPPIDAVYRVELCKLVERWIGVLCDSTPLDRSAGSNVASAVGRLADPNLAEALARLNECDLSAPDADRMINTRIYASAFAAMPDAAANLVLKRGLADIRWGIDAARALYEIWSAGRVAEQKPILGGWTHYPDHKALRSARADGPLPTSEFAEWIFDEVRTFGDPAKSDAEQRHAIGLAGIGFGLPHGDKRSELCRLLALPQPVSVKRDLLAAAARAGEVIPAAVLMEGLRTLLSEAREQTWRLDDNRGELMGWIDLFPFSDKPEDVLKAVRMLPEQHRQPHALRRLFETLPQSPGDTALNVLEGLAAADSNYFRESWWRGAARRLDTEQAALAMLDHLARGEVSTSSDFQMAHTIAAWARKFPKVRAKLTEHYRDVRENNPRSIFERAMIELVDESIFMALFDACAQGLSSPGNVMYTLRGLAIARRPLGDNGVWHTEVGEPLASIRARLFAMIPSGGPRAELAKRCLVEIDEIRDETGRIGSEPRHPDIASGRPWPPEAQSQ